MKEGKEKIEKWDTTWTKIDDLYWSDEAEKTGIYGGLLLTELENLNFLTRISAKPEYFKRIEEKIKAKLRERFRIRLCLREKLEGRVREEFKKKIKKEGKKRKKEKVSCEDVPKEWQSYAVVSNDEESKLYLKKTLIQERIKDGSIRIVSPDSALGMKIMKETGEKKFPIGVIYCPSCSKNGWIVF